jgi:hypothetical protein
MKKMLILVFTISLFACKPQENTTSGGGLKSSSNIKKANTLYGKFIVKSAQESDPNAQTLTPEYYFNYSGLDYFVNFSESQITKEDVKGVLFKEIDIRGEIKEGTIYLSTTTDGKKERAPNTEGIYVVVFEIIK